MFRNKPQKTFLDLRDMVTALNPQEAGLSPSARYQRVWGALMELGLENGTASLVTLIDGTTSMYTSTGGGIIGAGNHESVTEASLFFLDGAEALLGRLTPTMEVPLPRPGTVRFTVLTHDGRFTAEPDERDLRSGQHGLSKLYIAGHRVLTELRLLDEQRENADRPGH